MLDTHVSGSSAVSPARLVVHDDLIMFEIVIKRFFSRRCRSRKPGRCVEFRFPVRRPERNPERIYTRFQSEKVRISTASGKFALPQLFAATWQCPRVRGSPFATDVRARHLARRARTAVRASAPHTPPTARQGRRQRLAPRGSSSRPAPPARALILPSERSGVRDDDGLDGDDGVSRARRDGA